MARGSTTTHILRFQVETTGMPIFASSMNSVNTSATAATTSLTGLNTQSKQTAPAMQTAAGGANTLTGALGGVRTSASSVSGPLNSSNILAGQSAVAYNTASGGADKYSASTNRVQSSVLPLVSRLGGLAFAFAGLNAAAGEARGMQEILAMSQDKVNELTALQTQLIANNMQETDVYARVTNELEQAQRALTRQQTITNLSMQDQSFFLMAIASQAIPTVAKGMSSLLTKSKELGGGFTGLATTIGGALSGGFVKLTEKLHIIPERFTSAGRSANTFGTALRGLALNPFMIALTLITALIGVFTSNLFGARDAINAFGVYLGNTIPFLKPFLTLLGQAGDALTVAFGGSIRQVTADATAAQTPLRNLRTSIQDIYDVTNSQPDFKLTQQMVDLEKAIDDLAIPSKATDFTGFNKTLTNMWESNKAPSEAFNKKIIEISNAFITYGKDLKFSSVEMEHLHQLLSEAEVLHDKDLKALITKQAALGKTAEGTKLYSGSVLAVAAALEATAGPVQDEFVKGLDETQKAMFEIAKTTGLTGDALKDYLTNVEATAGVTKLFGENTVRAADGTALWQKSLQNIVAEEENVRATTDQLIKDIVTGMQLGVISSQEAAKAVELIGASSDVAGERVNKFLTMTIDETDITSEKLSTMIDIIALGGEVTVETEGKSQKSIQDTQKKLDEKIESLNLEAQTQGFSNKEKEIAIALHQDEQKELTETTETLRSLAADRGVEADALDVSDAALRKLISSREVEAVTAEEVANATTILIAQRESDQKAIDIEAAALRGLLTEMGSQIDTTNLSVSTMENLVTTYDDISNATQIAVGDVAEWNLELEREQTINAETVKALDDLAKKYGITIPDAIKSKGIPAIKAYIEQILGVGDAAAEAKEKALSAFDEMRSESQEIFEGIVSDKLGEDGDEVKKVIKGIDKIGQGMQSLAAKQTVIDIFLNDKNFENDVQGLSEIMELEYGDIENLTMDQALAIGNTFTANLREEVGKKGAPLADDVDLIWEQVQKSAKPGESAKEMIGRFNTALESSPGAVADAIRTGANDPLLAELGLLPPAAGKEAGKVGTEIANEMEKGKGPVTQAATLAFVDPVTGEVKKIPIEAGKGLQPVPGIFSQAFVDASTQTGIQLAAIILVVQQHMSNLSTSVATYANSMTVNWNMGIMRMGETLLPFGEAVFALQGVLSNFSTSVATYATSMTENWSAFFTTTQELYPPYIEQITAVHESFSVLSESVATYAESMTVNIEEWITVTTDLFTEYIEKVVELHQTFSDFSESVATYSKSMTKNLTTFTEDTTEAFDQMAEDVKSGIWQTMSDFSTSMATYSKSMANNVANAADSMISSLESFIDTVDDAIEAVQDFISILEEIPEKITVEIEQKFTTSGTKHFAKGGSFLVTQTTHIGDKIVGEEGPEIVTVTPLGGRGTKDTMKVNVGMPQSIIGNMPMGTSAGPGRAGGGSGSGPVNVRVTGNLNATLRTMSGRVLAEESMPYLMEGTHTLT